MDNAESVELDQESLEIFGPPATVYLEIYFKNGETAQLKFDVPVVTPIYTEPLTANSIYDILSTSYSFGEAPFLALPNSSGEYIYLDLNATNYTKIKVVEHE